MTGYSESLASHLLQSFYMPGLVTAQVGRDLEGSPGPNINEVIPVTLERVKNVIQMYFTDENLNKPNQLAFILAQTISLMTSELQTSVFYTSALAQNSTFPSKKHYQPNPNPQHTKVTNTYNQRSHVAIMI